MGEEEVQEEKQHAEVNSSSSSSSSSRIPNDPFSVKWTEKYHETLEKYWNRLPNFVGTFIASVAVFILGSTIRGEWLHILVHFLRAFKQEDNTTTTTTTTYDPLDNSTSYLFGINLAHYKLQGVGYYWLAAATVSYTIYLGIGGFLHWYYYIHQRDRAEEWKCQPNKFLPPDLERHEILLGSFSLLLGSTCSAMIACYIMNGGNTTIYYNVHEYSWGWYLLSWPVVFVWQDYLTYWHHRAYHLPFLYKHFHKMHHKYKQPTAFSVTAIHPIEFLHMQAVLASPMVLFPVHWTVFVGILCYIYYHGIIDHSGINFKAYWWQPWQPDCIFHDNHHQYFHVNFGFNCGLWDKIHGTYRQKDKVYREDIFYGKGKEMTNCSKDELTQALKETESENILAYRGNKVHNDQVKAVQEMLT